MISAALYTSDDENENKRLKTETIRNIGNDLFTITQLSSNKPMEILDRLTVVTSTKLLASINDTKM